MTAQTPVYGLKYPTDTEPVYLFRAALQANAESLEAALLSVGVPPPELADLTALAARVAVLEGQAAWTEATTATDFVVPVTTTWTDVPGMAATISKPAGRVVTVQFRCPVYKLTNNCGLDLRLYNKRTGVVIGTPGTWSLGNYSLWLGAQGLDAQYVAGGQAGGETIAVQAKSTVASSTLSGGGVGSLALRYR